MPEVLNSVRVRLLAMALLPMIVLMPVIMYLGLSRWTSDYDKVLIANVDSELRIAKQYLSRIMAGTGTDLQAVAAASEFEAALTGPPPELAAYLAQKQADLALDFLYFLPAETQPPQSWPVITSAQSGTARTEIDIFDPRALAALNPDLATRAQIELIPTEAAAATSRTVEDRGMLVHSASPVQVAGKPGVLVGGILLNRNLQFIDKINELVYLDAATGGDKQGTATLFLDDVRVSTNVRLFADVRALGTRVSAEVRSRVLDQGQTWLDRAFVVNDWYISGYLPIHDSFGRNVGMLYVGFLEGPYQAAKRAAMVWMLMAFSFVLLLSAPIFLWLANGIFAPLEAMTRTMAKVEHGDLSARNGRIGTGEIAAVAAHMDSLLGQVQDRDRELRDWADHLNSRVEDRTAELRDTNAKLEAATQQLVLSEKLASLGEITAGVAHEVNNPVAVIQGNVDLMRQLLGPEAKTVQTELSLIDQQVSRITAIVGKLLKFARGGAQGGAASLVDLHEVVADCLVLVDHVLSEKKIKVIQDLSAVAQVRIDPGEMQQVVINLITNAAQAMEDAGTLTLSLHADRSAAGPGVQLVFRDTGPGIPEDKLDNVFDPFFTTKLAEGTGLGLSISQRIIQQAGGRILARNTGQGAEFSVWLPVAVTGA